MTAEAYRPQRARTDDELVLDDHDRLLVAIEQKAAQWEGDAHYLTSHGAIGEGTAAAYRVHADQLRDLARAHSRRAR